MQAAQARHPVLPDSVIKYRDKRAQALDEAAVVGEQCRRRSSLGRVVQLCSRVAHLVSARMQHPWRDGSHSIPCLPVSGAGFSGSHHGLWTVSAGKGPTAALGDGSRALDNAMVRGANWQAPGGTTEVQISKKGEVDLRVQAWRVYLQSQG